VTNNDDDKNNNFSFDSCNTHAKTSLNYERGAIYARKYIMNVKGKQHLLEPDTGRYHKDYTMIATNKSDETHYI
jgi:hypothetical protein